MAKNKTGKWIQLNPIMKKELQTGSRSMKMSWGIFGLNALLSVIVILFMYVLEQNSAYSGYDYGNLVSLFPILAVMECAVLSLMIPVITSGSISGERERQTLDIMLTTPVRPFSIALGKLGCALIMVMMYIVSSIPALSVAFVLGGLQWSALPGLIGMMLFIGVYIGSLGIFCSSFVKKSISATVLTLVIEVLVAVLTVVVFFLLWYTEEWAASAAGRSVNITYQPLILLLNPYSAFFDFLSRSITTYSIYSIISRRTGHLPVILDTAYRFWIPAAIVVNLLISFVFLKLAAVNIRTTRIRRSRKKRKKA